MKIEDNHYTYRIETKDSNGGSLDFIDIDTVEPLRCAYDVQDELNLETNEHIKRVEEIVLDANSTEFWYVDEARTSDTHLVCYFEEVELMASKDHSMVDTNRSVFEYGKINSNEHQNTNFICTHVMDNGVSRIYMSIDKTIFEFATFNNETIKHFISNNPVTVWYALRYEVIIPRSLSKGHLLTLSGQTDITLTTTSEQAKLPIMKFNIGDTQYTLDNNPIHINNTQEGTQIRNIVLEGNTPINYARGNGVNTTEQVSNTRYDFEPFYDGQATIQGTVEGGYVSAKLYGDTMVNIAKSYGETPLLTATNESTLCDDLLGINEEGIVLADGEITEGRIYGDSFKLDAPVFQQGYGLNIGDGSLGSDYSSEYYTNLLPVPISPFTFGYGYEDGSASKMYAKVVFYDDNGNYISGLTNGTERKVIDVASIPTNATQVRYGMAYNDGYPLWKYKDGTDVYNNIQSVVNPTIISNGIFKYGILDVVNGGAIKDSQKDLYTDFLDIPTRGFCFDTKNAWARLAFYNENKEFITYIQTGNHNYAKLYVNTSNIPSDAKYIRYGFSGTNLKDTTIKYTDDSTDVYPNLKLIQATFPYTLNKLLNGVADYIDVVNKVHVQRVGKVVLDGTQTFGNTNYNAGDGYYTKRMLIDNSVTGKFYMSYGDCTSSLCDKLKTINYEGFANKLYEFVAIGGSELTGYNSGIFIKLLASTNSEWEERLAQLTPITVLYELATPIYTPLTDEEIAQLPLSAYADGYVMLSSDQLIPSFEFRMRASNRYQVDMLETGYYYLNAPVGNVKLGTANVDVQQMPCIIKVDNVGTDDSGYRLGFDGGNTSFLSFDKSNFTLGYYYGLSGELLASGRDCACEEYIPISTGDSILINQLHQSTADPYSVTLILYDSDKNMIERTTTAKDIVKKIVIDNVAYFRFSCIHDRTVTEPTTKVAEVYINPITLAKLPSHRIPTTFTQGMRCGTDFGYWEGIKEAQTYGVQTANKTTIDGFGTIELYGIEIGGSFIEDEFDISIGKLTKRIGVKKLVGIEDWKVMGSVLENSVLFQLSMDGVMDEANTSENYVFNDKHPRKTGDRLWSTETYGVGGNTNVIRIRLNLPYRTVDEFKRFLSLNPITVYYRLRVPEITYLTPQFSQMEATNSSTRIDVLKNSANNKLFPQVKPSHLTYPVPSLVGNRTYTVVHNHKNISGSTKPIELNLGGTVVQLNDASSKTLVKTPSTLAHNNLIFIGGESTVDHVMVLDGDWTNKPIEYFENMKGHDTDAIITIIGDGKIDDVPEQYLW